MTIGQRHYNGLNGVGASLAMGVLCLCLGALPAVAQPRGGSSAQTAPRPAASANDADRLAALGPVVPSVGQRPADPPAQGATSATSGAASANALAELSPVMIVGSRIPESTIAPARPVVILSAQDLAQTGLTNVGQILQHVTAAGSTVNSNVDVGGNGGTQLSLRNLGANRTLILVNGKRWITGLDGAVDLDQIPTSVIKSVQILNDGASAIYGSDAIAGVVNIITRKNFVGAEANAYIGEYNYGSTFDGPVHQYSFVLGTGNDKGNITLAAQYQESDAIPDCSRPISCVPYYGTPIGSSFSPNGRFIFYPPPGNPLYTNATLCPPSHGSPLCDVTTIPGTAGDSIADFKPWTSADAFNYAQLYDLVAPNQATNLYLQGDYAFNDHVEFHTTAMYSHHVNVESYSPVNLDIGPGGNGTLISATNPYNPFGCDLNGNISAPSPGECQLVLAGMRILAGGFREFTATQNTFYFNGGLNGNFRLGERKFIWSVDYTFGQELEWDLTPVGEYNTQRLSQALGPISGCGPGSGCVPMDYFGSGGITSAMLHYVGASEQSTTQQSMRDYEVNLSSGDVLDLPGGPVGFNVGDEYQKLHGDDHPDSLQEAGISTDGTVSPTAGGYWLNSVYGELHVPLLQKLPLVKEMAVDLAARYSKYSTFGTNTIEQVGFRWQPDNQVLIRASWGKGFRAPDISELFSGQSESFPFALDPCNYGLLPTEPAQTATRCAAAGVPVGVYTQPTNGELSNVLVGGNPHLNPETSVSRTVGFVVNPNAVPGLTVNADYFKINVNDIISTISAQNILNGCYIGGVSSFCDLVHRNGTGIITSLIDTETNVGDVVTEGIDFGGSYGFDTRLGRFNIAVQSTYTTEYNEIVPNGTGGTVTYHLAGWEDGSSYLSYPKDKTILTTTWSRGDWAALWRMRYIGSMLEDCTGFTSYGVCSDPNPNHYSYTGQSKIPTNELGSTVYNDASVTYAIDLINSKITLGVNNLLNRNPPVSYTAHNLSFDPTTYDIPGRFIYLSLTANF